jgi:hypothetical protein
VVQAQIKSNVQQSNQPKKGGLGIAAMIKDFDKKVK